MKFLSRPLAITDIETTGLDAQVHEILEIGLLVVSQKDLRVLDEFEIKIKPSNIRRAAKKALGVCGYSADDWKYAVNLRTAMEMYSEKCQNAVFVAHNSFFEWSFINEAFKNTGVEDPMDYHRADLFSIAFSRAKKMPGVEEFTFDSLCRYLKIPPEPKPHRALNGAHRKLTLLEKLLKL